MLISTHAEGSLLILYYFMHTEIIHTCVALVVSMVTVPLDIENALCDNGVQYGKNITIVGSDPDSSIPFLFE